MSTHIQTDTRSLDEMLTEAFLDGLDLGRLEWQRKQYDFPLAQSPRDEVEQGAGWPYSDEDD